MHLSHSVPSFAVVGRVNKGKSAILATLVEEDRNARIRVSPTPGETTRCQRIPLVINGETLVEFIDTPGFSDAPAALEWMKNHHEEGGASARIDTVRAFIEAHRRDESFQDECLLLEPIVGHGGGAFKPDATPGGILYVVDASKPFRPDFLAEMEILRWTGRPRMALLNKISSETDFTEEWKKHLGETFNLTREFNANHARFAERIRLLRSLLEIEESAAPAIEKTIRLLEEQWDQRRSESADVVIDLLQDCLTTRTTKNISKEKIERDYQKKKAVEELKEKYIREIEKLEAAYHEKLLGVYRHTQAPVYQDETGQTAPGGPGAPGPSGAAGMLGDLFSEESWQLLGLNKWQLAFAGGVAGVAAGGTVDVLAGGHFFGMPTAIGGLTGFAAPLLTGRALAQIRIDIPFLPGTKTSAGGVQLKAGPPKNPNFPWVLLDRVLFHYHNILIRAHGRRDPFVIRRGPDSRSGFTVKFTSQRRNKLQSWFSKLLKGKNTGDTDEIFNELRAILEEIETGKL